MASITSQAKLEEGLNPVSSELMATSKGLVSNQGMHIPDLDLIDGKNIMPTLFGYTSFFGLNSKVGADAIDTQVQDVLSYRTFTGNTVLIALCRDGLFLKALAGEGTGTVNETATEVTVELENNQNLSWTRILTTIPSGPFENWTYVIIRNKLYLYQKGLGKILRLDGDVFGTLIFQKLDPSYIIGTGQKNSFTITIEDDSDQPAGGTYKEFEYLLDAASLGKFRVPIGTAVKVSQAPKVWESLLASSGLFSAHVTETSRIETDFSFWVTPQPHPYKSLAGYTDQDGFDADIEDADFSFDLEAAIDGPESRISVVGSGLTPKKFYILQNIFDLPYFNAGAAIDVDIEVNLGSGIYQNTFTLSWVAGTYSAYQAQEQWFNFVQSIADWVYNNVNGNYDLFITNMTSWSHVDGTFGSQGTCLIGIGLSDQAINSFDLGYIEVIDNIAATTIVYDFSDPDLVYDVKYGFGDPLNFDYRRRVIFQAELQSNSTPGAGDNLIIQVPGVTATIPGDGIKTIRTLMKEAFDFIVATDPTNYSILYEDVNLEYYMLFENTGDVDPFIRMFIGDDTSFWFPTPVCRMFTIGHWYINPDDTLLSEPWWHEFPPIKLTGFNYGDSSYITVSYFNDDGEQLNSYALNILDYDTVGDAVAADSDTWTEYEELAVERCEVDYTIDVVASQLDDAQVPTTDTDKDGTTVFTVSAITETPDPLAQVEGIMSARDRLGAWTKLNKIHWSSPSDVTDFTPSKTTQANELSVNAIRGNIVHCLGYDNGFVIYSTGNVVIGRYVGGQFIYDFKAIEQSSGCIDPRHITGNLSSHYYWSELGLQVVIPSKGDAQVLDQALTDWLNKYRFPIQLKLVNNRFLAIGLQYEPHKFSYRQQREATTPSAVQDGYLAQPFNPPSDVSFPVVLFGRNLYPTFKRALLFDILLSKWGTCDVDHKVLYSLNPMNQQGFPIEKDYFLRDASLQNELRGLAVLDEDGYSWLADTHSEDAYALFGKYSVHRYRETKLVELFIEMVNKPVDTVAQIERTIAEHELYDITQDDRVDGIQNRLDLNLAGNWFNLLVRGEQFHLKRLMARGYAYGR